MNFKNRLFLVLAVLLCAALVIFVPLDTHGSVKSDQCTHYDEVLKIVRDFPLVPRDMIVVDADAARNKSFDELRLARFKEVALQLREVAEKAETSDDLGELGSVFDCTTWNVKVVRKLDVVNIDVFPQELVYVERSGERLDNRIKTLSSVYDKQVKDKGTSNGMALYENGQRVIAILHVVVTKLKQKLKRSSIKIIDIWCIFSPWLRGFLHSRPDVLYACINPVPGATEVNNLTDIHHLDNVEFYSGDVVGKPLYDAYDLVLCRNLIQHLWHDDIFKTLFHISQSKSKYLLISHFPNITENEDRRKNATHVRENECNLELLPFNLEPPICSSSDGSGTELALWKLPLQQKYYDTN